MMSPALSVILQQSPKALPRSPDSFFWLELRGTYPYDAVWCKCCEVLVAERNGEDIWEPTLGIYAHFDTTQHRQAYELVRLAGETD